MELYKKLRPKGFKDVVGQPEAVKTLQAMAANGRFPQAMLFTGPSGVGKTTLARIVREKLKCSPHDFVEINAANARGIEMAREIATSVSLAPMFGPTRVWLIDEAHQTTKEAQSAMLKVLEDTPKHAYLMLATTEPTKLLRTIVTRCTEIKLAAIRDEDVARLLRGAAGTQGEVLSKKVEERITEAAEGSARKALVILDQVIRLKSEEERLDAIQKSDSRQAAFDLVKALMPYKGTVSWGEVSKVLKGLENDDAEGVRRLVLATCKTHMLNDNGLSGKAYNVYRRFQYNFYDSGFCGLVAACREVLADSQGQKGR